MNLLVLLPFALLIVPFIPAIIEIFKRKDKGPREIPEQTTYEEPPDIVEISRLERARGDARAKAPGDVIRITGNVSIPEGSEINNNLMVQGNLKIGKKSRIYGSIKAFGDIELDESSTVEGHVLSEGKVTIGRNCVVKGIVDSLKDIILGENAVVEAVSTEKTVKLGPNAKINRRILSGASIITVPPQIREEQAVKPEEAAPAPELKAEEEKPQISKEAPLKPLPAPPVEEKPAVIGGEIPFEVLDPEADHLYLYAPTRYGKTYLIRNYIIPRLAGKKKIVVIDGHREYPFEPYSVNYDKTIPNIENDLFKTFITFSIWGDIEGIIDEMISHVAQAKGNISIRPNIVDSNVEKLIISEFLKRMTQVKWKVPILLIIEEADKYDVLSAVTRGRHANMQVVLTSAKRLMPEVFSNARLVLGSINPTLIREYDPYAAEAVATLGRHEFIWEKDYHDWRRFRLGQEQPRQLPSKPRMVEEKRHVEEIKVAPMLEPSPPMETAVEPRRLTDSIFEYLEERIRMLERSKASQIEPVSLEGLTPIEAKVFEAAHKCRSSEEICLRFMMDPIEVEEAINSLMDKGYLDKDLKPKIPPASRPSAKETSVKRIEKKRLREEKREEDMLSENALIERLIASKIRKELKKRIEKIKEKSSTAEQKADGDKSNVVQKAIRGGISDILKEWRKASSLIWGSREPETADDQSSSKSTVEIDESLAEDVNENSEKNEERFEKSSGRKD